MSLSVERLAGLGFVFALHAAALWGLWQHRLIPTPAEAVTLFVNFITPPVPEKKVVLKPPPPKPTPIEKPQLRPQPQQIVAATPVVVPTDYVAPPPPPLPVVEATPVPPAPPAPPKPAGPIMLGGELSVACPERTPPRYPHHSRRMGEEGAVVLRVELDEQGNISAARVSASSGFARLDEAALGAVRTWRCIPPTHHGRPVRAIAVQPFNFVLQGS
ncbi:MAG: energy transducer TonB [Rhodocyclaceae bacterium]|nr:energy transducer TonB [Rhodocyclaceae bacterium]MDZ4216633.1 energy transducer TonB [Rhodocyclaceae bacterium]